MNVLSLFDGMSCGQIAFERAGFKVKTYISSEIDKSAIVVAKANYPNTKHIGDIRDLTEDQLLSYGNIDVLIGGSPCQGFSIAGKMKGATTKDGLDVTSLDQYLELKRLGFEFDGQSYLFWEYIRIWNIVNPKYHLLENVRVTKKWLPMFNEAMGSEPIMINSRLVSAQNRVRYYWTNILGVSQPEDKGIVLSDILQDEVDQVYYAGRDLQLGYVANEKLCGASRGRYLVDGKRQDGKMKTAGMTEQMLEVRPDNKTNCLTTVCKDNLVVTGLDHGDRIPILKVREATKKGFIEVYDKECFDNAVPNSKTRRGRNMKDKSNALLTSNGFMRFEYPTFRKFTPIECERLQTVPDNYTAHVSDSQRYKMLGNGWTVDVIAHIFKNIPRS